MGQSSSTSTQQSQTSPWTQAMPELSGLFGQLNGLIPNTGTTPAQQAAISQLTANGQAGNPYAPAVGGVATNLLSGGGATSQNPALTTNLSNFESGMAPYTNPNYSTLSSPAVQNALQQIQSDTTNNINGQFAAAGRSGSGMNTQTLARGIAQAEAPLILNQANTDTATRQAALNSVYGAGNTTSGIISNNNQTGNVNAENGITASNNAVTAQNWGPQQVLQAQQYLQSIPASNLGLLANIGIPLAELGRTSNGTSTTQNDPSLLQDFGMFTQGLGNLIPKGPLNFNFGG